MPRYKLTIEYDGGPFVGWQRQKNGPSVQGALEQAAESLMARRARFMARAAPIPAFTPWARSRMWIWTRICPPTRSAMR